MRTVAAAALSALVALAALTPTREARAEGEFTISVTPGKIEVKGTGDWHMNKEYPWKFTVGKETKAKDAFVFADHDKVATLAGPPKGAGKLKGAVCSGDKCVNFEKDITAQ